jgi:hypothetical protein
MKARDGHHLTASRPVSPTVGEPTVRPAGYTNRGHHFQRRRSRLVFV